MRIGVLSLQGAFREHCRVLKKLNTEALEVRLPEQLKQIDALIIPGGESTTIIKLMGEYNLTEKIKQFTKPIFGTCAGTILLANLNKLDIKVKRNAYGRQINSFETDLDVKGLGRFHGIFIRAPKITEVKENVEILATHDNNPVLVKQGKYLAATFHPELTQDNGIHKLFLSLC